MSRRRKSIKVEKADNYKRETEEKEKTKMKRGKTKEVTV